MAYVIQSRTQGVFPHDRFYEWQEWEKVENETKAWERYSAWEQYAATVQPTWKFRLVKITEEVLAG